MATYGDEVICTYKYTKPRESLDSSRLKKEMPDLYASFVKVGEPQSKLYVRIGGE